MKNRNYNVRTACRIFWEAWIWCPMTANIKTKEKRFNLYMNYDEV